MKTSSAALLILLAAAAAAGEGWTSYSPRTRQFACLMPPGWSALLEEEEPSGYAAHLLEPAKAGTAYRAGIDIHFVESGRPGFIDAKAEADRLRKHEAGSNRSAGPMKRVNSGSGPARYLEIEDSRRLPAEEGPAKLEDLKEAVALIPGGGGASFFVLRLSSTKEDFLDNRDRFLRLVQSFRVTGE